MSTYFPSGAGLAQNRKWYVVDAAGKTVGHLASEVAAILTGKRNPKWTPFLDMGDHVIVVNARKAMFTGSKATDKVYRRHTLYPGGLRQTTVTEMFTKHPERVIEFAVKGMLPKTKLGKAMAKKLKVYADAEHPHSAQLPQPLELPSRKNQKEKIENQRIKTRQKFNTTGPGGERHRLPEFICGRAQAISWLIGKLLRRTFRTNHTA